MTQTVQDIIARSAWAVDDEFFNIVKKGELIKSLDRVYREYCDRTRILSKIIGFKTTTETEYDLYGPVDDGTIFGDEFRRIYRLEYNGVRAVEKTFEEVKQVQVNNVITRDTEGPLPYAIRYLQKYKRIYFGFTPTADDEVIFWWYRVPRIGTLTLMSDTFDIDDMRTDDLVLGLNVIAWRSLMVRYAALNRNTLAQLAVAEFKLAKEEWDKRILDVQRDVLGFTDELTPTLVEINPPFEELGDDVDYVTEYTDW